MDLRSKKTKMTAEIIKEGLFEKTNYQIPTKPKLLLKSEAYTYCNQRT